MTAQPEQPTQPSWASLKRQALFWAAGLALLIAFIWLFYGILLPFVGGAALAYLLDPLANRIERFGVNRGIATLLIIGAFALILAVLATVMVPILVHQFTLLIEKAPSYLEKIQALVSESNREWLESLLGTSIPNLQIGAFAKEATGAVAIFVRSLWSGGSAIVSLASFLVVTPVVAFYLLYDWNRMLATIDGWLPRDNAETIRGLAREIDAAVAGFVRGQTLVCIALGVFYAVGLSLAGLNFALLIGLMAGVLTFIPYVGSITGFLTADAVAVAQFWPSASPIMIVVGVFVIGQALEGYVLSPKLVGDKVGLHPVWLMFALFAFGYLFGFVGLIVAIPVSAAVGVLVRFALRQYLASPLYHGNDAH
jgi:predicted PurR-regulated permease PerM